MRRLLKWTLLGLLAILLLAVLGTTAVVTLNGRAPAPRPDLVTADPAGTPAPPPGYATPWLAFVDVGLGHIQPIPFDEPVPSGITQQKDVEYGRLGDRPLVLDLYRPTSSEGMPVPGLLFVHGGAWAGGEKEIFHYYCLRFAERGYVVGTVGYRLAGEAKFPAAIEDVKCAIRWMRANAAPLGVDPNRIGIMGGSAGGHLALLAAYAPNDPALEGSGGHAGVSTAVQAVVSFYPPSDLTTDFTRHHDAVVGFLGAPYEEAPERYTLASPLHHLDAGDPPTLLIHGTVDNVVPVEQSDLLAEKLIALGIPYGYDRLEGWPHAMDAAQSVNDRCVALMADFFARHLGGAPAPTAPAAG
jgi:acetyl esterase/lipase